MMKHYFNTNKVLSVTALAIGAITIFFACKKDDKAGADEARDTQTMAAAQRETEINAVYDDAFGVVLDANSYESGLNGTDGGRWAPGNPSHARCYSLSFDPVELGVFPKTVELNFGDGCTDGGGPTRKGKIKVVVSELFFLPGAEAVITFENYSVNGIKVEGTQTLTNLSGTNGFGYSYSVKDGKLTYPNGAVYLYEGTRNLVQKEGADTKYDVIDDMYELTGTATLKDSVNTATVNITKALERRFDCSYISKGTVTVTVNGHAASIDYGNGDCDEKAMITVGDKTKEITLSK
ncbi:hypothetical protein [Chitinophaga sp.]|uniref:hypothetical protein n=1 Tax=Chitinophaga sp. TaxID=1869181 RepID=UPI0031D4EE07